MIVDADEAKMHLFQLLERVTKGECILISRHGVPIAELAPVNTVPTDERLHAIAQLRQFRRGKHAGASLWSMIEEGRE